MGADHDRGILGDFAWQHEPYRVARRSRRVPVYLVARCRLGTAYARPSHRIRGP